MKELTDKERSEAMRALTAWFKSQDINPQEAALIMLELMALCLVDKTKDIDALQSACENFRMGLVMNVALMLKGAYP